MACYFVGDVQTDMEWQTGLVSPRNHKNNWEMCLRDISAFIFLRVWWKTKGTRFRMCYGCIIYLDKTFPVVLLECCWRNFWMRRAFSFGFWTCDCRLPLPRAGTKYSYSYRKADLLLILLGTIEQLVYWWDIGLFTHMIVWWNRGPSVVTCFGHLCESNKSECDTHSDQWRTQEFFSGGVQQI